jgi:hypothetical protein
MQSYSFQISGPYSVGVCVCVYACVYVYMCGCVGVRLSMCPNDDIHHT